MEDAIYCRKHHSSFFFFFLYWTVQIDTNHLILWNTVLYGKVGLSLMVEKYHAFQVSWRFITMCTNTQHWSVSSVIWLQFTPSILFLEDPLQYYSLIYALVLQAVCLLQIFKTSEWLQTLLPSVWLWCPHECKLLSQIDDCHVLFHKKCIMFWMFIFLAVNDCLICSQLLTVSFIETNETPVVAQKCSHK
jgi:hypothetical protein